MRIGREVLACYSYRDPTPDRTLTIYRGAADFLRAFVDSGERLDKFVISTVAETEPLMSPREEGLRGDQLWFAGRTDEMLRRDRAQILATDAQQLLGWCDALETMGRTGAVCVVAHEGALKDCAGENLSIVE
jgi:Zn-dependent M16 (insulinase) family peptidase